MVEGALHELKDKPGTCVECGNSPVRHIEHYAAATLSIWAAESAYARSASHALARAVEKILDAAEQPFFRLLARAPFVGFSTAIEAAATYRSQVVWEEAARRGIEMEQLVVFGRGTEVYRARIGSAWHYFHSIPVPYSMRSAHIDWIDDKYLLKRALFEGGVPAPRSISVRTVEEALRAFRAIAVPAVVKPRSGSRGRHTAVGLRKEEDVAAALRSARQLCRYAVVEEYLEGSVCRGTVVGGRLAGLFEARPPTIVGDGASTIAELVEAANGRKPKRVLDIVLSGEHERFLARRGLMLDSVPERGLCVPLSHRTGRLFGGRTRELLGKEHPKLRAYLERAARLLEIPVVGFDLVIAEPERDPDGQRWGIIEANTLPYIDLHYLPLEGEPSNVACAVWDLWDVPMHSGGVDEREARATMTA